MKVIYNDGHVAECPEDEELHVIRHTAAHILAQAVKRLYPEAHFAYGPATEKGFYYDVDLGDKKLSDENLPAIEAEMAKIVKENLPINVRAQPRGRGQADGGARRNLQGRAHRRSAGGRGAQLLPAGRIHRYVRRPAPDLHQGAQGV